MELLSNTAVGDTLFVAEPYGWNEYQVSRWTVEKVTPSGQVVAKSGNRKIRVSNSGRIIGERGWSRRHVISPEEAAAILARSAERDRWMKIRTISTSIDRAARSEDLASFEKAFAELSKAKALIASERKA